MTQLKEVEEEWLTAMARLSRGEDPIRQTYALKQAWLELENYPEWHGKALLMKSQEIAQEILNKHPEWSSEIVRVGR